MRGWAGGAQLCLALVLLPCLQPNTDTIPVVAASQVSKFLLFSFQTLFGNKPAGFGATTTSAPSFGTTTGGGLFGNEPALSLGAPANPSSLGTGKKNGVSVI